MSGERPTPSSVHYGVLQQLASLHGACQSRDRATWRRLVGSWPGELDLTQVPPGLASQTRSILNTAWFFAKSGDWSTAKSKLDELEEMWRKAGG